MSDPDDLELLLRDVRKTISDNRQFLKVLVEERDFEEPDEDDEPETVATPEEGDEFEEL